MEVRDAGSPSEWEALTFDQLVALVLGKEPSDGHEQLLVKRLEEQKSELPGMSVRQIEREFDVKKPVALRLFGAVQLGVRCTRADAPTKTPIRGPEEVLPHVRDLVRAKREHFIVLLLNARHEVLRRETVSIGSLNASIVHPREVFLPAILNSAASIVLVHNHPSGDPEPSEEDLSITRRLVEAGELVGIGVLDHVIVAAKGHTSFRARQLL